MFIYFVHILVRKYYLHLKQRKKYSGVLFYLVRFFWDPKGFRERVGCIHNASCTQCILSKPYSTVKASTETGPTCRKGCKSSPEGRHVCTQSAVNDLPEIPSSFPLKKMLHEFTMYQRLKQCVSRCAKWFRSSLMEQATHCNPRRGLQLSLYTPVFLANVQTFPHFE